MSADDVRILPMVDWIGDTPIRHGERGSDLDPVHPEACLCGFEPYYWCDGPGIEMLTLYAANTPDEAANEPLERKPAFALGYFRGWSDARAGRPYGENADPTPPETES